MTRALAIFRKDARHLWPYGVVIAAVFAVAGALDPVATNHRPPDYLEWSIPLACWTIIVLAIHQERLPGDRQNWLTLPITSRDLLAAKIMFLLVFVNLPLLLFHAAVWTAVGIPTYRFVSAHLWRELFFTALYVLPAAALAAITRNLGQTILAALLACAAWIGTLMATHRANWMVVDWRREALFAALLTAGGCIVLLIQYSRRATRLAAGIAAATFAAIVIAEFLINPSPLRRGGFTKSPLRIVLDKTPDPLWRPGRNYWGARIWLDIPIRIERAEATELRTGAVTAWVHRPGEGSRGIMGGPDAALSADALSISLSPDFAPAIRSGTLNVGGSALPVLFRPRGSAHIAPEGKVTIPGAGVCFPERGSAARFWIACFTPLPRVSLFAVSGEGGRPNWIIPNGLATEPVLTSDVFQPVEKHTSQIWHHSPAELSAARLISSKAVAEFEQHFHFSALRFREPRLNDWRP